jgi:hypothetical protein
MTEVEFIEWIKNLHEECQECDSASDVDHLMLSVQLETDKWDRIGDENGGI